MIVTKSIRIVPLSLALLFIAGLTQGCAGIIARRFDTPEQASQSLVQALRANDTGQLRQILGRDAADVLSSGDEVADAQERETFLKAFDEKHRVDSTTSGSLTLVVGNDDWPLPIPIVNDEKKGKWFFDTAAGKDEIISRRIGSNELYAIQVCLAIVDAQREYAMKDPAGAGLPVYAQKFFSDPGSKNGLYWETATGEEPSPLGQLVARAQGEGYSPGSAGASPNPFHGYLFRILKSQGPDAPGGAFDYLAGDKMIGGFGVVAYPAEYGNSGVMSFIVNTAGIVYQKDLGSGTERIARDMKAFNPAPGWVKVEPSPAVQP